MYTPLPVPPVIAKTLKTKSETIAQVDYEATARLAEDWAKQHHLRPAATDTTRIALLIVDNQNTFSLPPRDKTTEKTGYAELAVAGAPASSVRIAEFIYRNLGIITSIHPTMDTHTIMQVFHQFWLIDDNGNHPVPGVPIPLTDIEGGKWKINPAVAYSIAGSNQNLGGAVNQLNANLIHYARTLAASGKYPLMVWPYHSMLGGVGHALVASTEEACHFHTIARATQTRHEMKGGNPLTENFSIFAPEVLTDAQGRAIAQRNARFLNILLQHDIIVIVGQAKSHCVAWTIEDLLTEITRLDPTLARKVYLPEDCTDPVVIPGVIDFTADANAKYQKFAAAGMHIVKSTDPINTWEDVKLAA